MNIARRQRARALRPQFGRRLGHDPIDGHQLFSQQSHLIAPARGDIRPAVKDRRPEGFQQHGQQQHQSRLPDQPLRKATKRLHSRVTGAVNE